jgi:hypothetical protein
MMIRPRSLRNLDKGASYSIYEEIGGFDRRLSCAGEDWEMWVRIATRIRSVLKLNRWQHTA